ncbi:MAG: tetratricopeptide repeat protein [Alphaproteobacteria bacterium]|nr:tetratricopeptide repeat protein [Alphaproteobacteria bacterium]
MMNKIIELIVILVSLHLISCQSKDDKLVGQVADYLIKKDYSRAAKLLDEAKALNPQNTCADLYRCRLYLLQDQADKAGKCLDKALTDPGFDSRGSLFFETANLFFKKSQYINAIRCYDAAIKAGEDYSHSYALKSDPSPGAETRWFRKYSFYYFFRANASALNGKCQEALKYYNASINLANKGLRSQDLLQEGVDLMFSDETSDRLDYRRYVGSFFVNRGIVAEKIGLTDEAAQNRQNADQLNFYDDLVLDTNEITCEDN